MRRERASDARPTLLLVEDDAAVRRVLRDMLRRAGYVVREAANGIEALEALAGTLPDAIVLDVILPALSGLDVLDRLHASGLVASVPVIAVTGSIVPDAVMREKGARRVLRKPFSLRDLHEAVESVTSRRLARSLARLNRSAG